MFVRNTRTRGVKVMFVFVLSLYLVPTSTSVTQTILEISKGSTQKRADSGSLTCCVLLCACLCWWQKSYRCDCTWLEWESAPNAKQARVYARQRGRHTYL